MQFGVVFIKDKKQFVMVVFVTHAISNAFISKLVRFIAVMIFSTAILQLILLFTNLKCGLEYLQCYQAKTQAKAPVK